MNSCDKSAVSRKIAWIFMRESYVNVVELSNVWNFKDKTFLIIVFEIIKLITYIQYESFIFYFSAFVKSFRIFYKSLQKRCKTWLEPS